MQTCIQQLQNINNILVLYTLMCFNSNPFSANAVLREPAGGFFQSHRVLVYLLRAYTRDAQKKRVNIVRCQLQQ